jgi:hypothetical protein
MSGPTRRPVRRSLDDAAGPRPSPGPPAREVASRPRAAATGFRERGRLRRRLRYLRRARELGYRDLGGFIFDLHRFGREGADLVQSKLAALMAIDGELRALEAALGEHREVAVLREPGIGSCLKCGALHGSTDSFCPHCGRALRPGAKPAGGSNDAPTEALERAESDREP